MDAAAVLDTYRVDTDHARHVAALSLALFDVVYERYGLPAGARRLLELGSLLHNVGLTTDPPDHHIVGRDIVLRHPIEGLSQRDHAIVACLVAFHRKKVRPQQEPAYLSLSKKGRDLARRLAAILRVGDGLDYSQSQTTGLETVEPVEGGLRLRLCGPHAARDGARAVAKADLWFKEFGETLEAVADGLPAEAAADDGAEEDAPVLAPWYAAPDVPLAELGRVLLRRHFRKLLAAERKVRADKDIEAVHDLRVASRRLRATLRLLEPVAGGQIRPYAKAIGRLAKVAGAVRDRDVLLADLEARAAELPESLRPGLEELCAGLRAERTAAYKALIALIDGGAHADFKRDFAELMCRHDGWDDGPRVRDTAGSLIWHHYEALRAFDRGGLPTDGEELHAMRIAGKRLRYLLELFVDTFGERSAAVIGPLMVFQDHLGVIQDVAVAQATLEEQAGDEASRAALSGYLALRLAEAGRLRDELPARWEKVGSATYRRNLLGLIVKL